MTVQNRDTSTIASICSQLQAESWETMQAELHALERRFPGLARRVVIALGGFGAEAAVSPLGLATRSEWTELLRQGKCYGWVGSIGAIAAQNGFAQLRNPAGSTKNLLVRLSLADNGGAGAVSALQLRLENAVIGAGNNLGTRLLPPLAGPNSLGLVNTGTQVGTTGTVLSEETAPLNTVVRFLSPAEFICELPVGWGLDVFNSTVNQALRVNFAWAEVDASYPV